MSKRIDRVDVRARLPLQRDPYWQRVTQGRFIGFRRMTRGTPGTWLVRFDDPTGKKKYVYRKLGDFAALPENERYDAALKAAQVEFRHVDLGGSTEPGTVQEACEAYVEKKRSEEGEQPANDVEGFFKRTVYSDPIASRLLSKLSRADVSAWRARTLKQSKSKSSFNRNITPLRAALNLAHEDGKTTNDSVWLKALKPLNGDGAENRREGTLDHEQRRALVACASDEARSYIKTLALLPLRPGEVASLRVEHLNTRERVLKIPAGKTKVRVVPLTDEAQRHFQECAKGKLPSAWLISRADGSQWKARAWGYEIKDAASKAKLPRATLAYTLRHSLITDLLVGGLDAFTVSAISGTSLTMIQKHYGHLVQEHARSALERLALGARA